MNGGCRGLRARGIARGGPTAGKAHRHFLSGTFRSSCGFNPRRTTPASPKQVPHIGNACHRRWDTHGIRSKLKTMTDASSADGVVAHVAGRFKAESSVEPRDKGTSVPFRPGIRLHVLPIPHGDMGAGCRGRIRLVADMYREM